MADHLPPPPPGAPPPPPLTPPGSRSVQPEFQQPRFAVPFNAFDGLGLVIWTLVAQLIVGVGLAVVVLVTGNDQVIEDGGALQQGVGLLVVAAAAQLFTLAGVFVWLHLRRRLSSHLFGGGDNGFTKVLLGLGAGLGGYLLVTLLIVVGSTIIDIGEPSQAALDASIDSRAAFLLGLVVAGLLAPILEEVVFRGVLFQALRHRMGVGWGVALSSLAFALVHIELIAQPVFLGALFVLAAYLALLLHWTRSLVVPIVAHSTFNVITLLLAWLAPELEV